MQMKTVVATLCLVLFASASFAQGGLDSSFGPGGMVTTFFGGDGLNGDEAHSVVVQKDGKLVVGGSTTNLDETKDFALARYNGNGTLDTTFGTGGKVKTTFADIDYVAALALQSDGKIVAAGMTIVNFSPMFAVARYNSNGTLDPTFGTGGKVTTSFGGPTQAFAAAVQADGKIVVAGYAHLTNGWRFALARYNSNGTLDSTFGSGGKKTTAFGSPTTAQVNSITIQPDGKIVASGGATVDWQNTSALARFN